VALTVEIRRAADGALVASRQPSDGHFRAKVKRFSPVDLQVTNACVV
jgi:hypothetical protein